MPQAAGHDHRKTPSGPPLEEEQMTSRSRNARIAGFLYLSLVIASPLRYIYIPGALIVRSDATVTAGRIIAHETLFRLGMVTDLFCGTICIFIALALYRLLKDVDQSLAVLMVIVGGVMPSAIYFFNVVNDAAALILVRGAGFLSVFDQRQQDALALLFLRMHDQEIFAAEIFWGLWLFPLAILVYRSRFLPRFLGVWLIINGLAYVATSLTGFLFPRYVNMVGNVTFPAVLGEVAFVLWLLIKGAKEQTVNEESNQ
jgi:hypothetical protein